MIPYLIKDREPQQPKPYRVAHTYLAHIWEYPWASKSAFFKEKNSLFSVQKVAMYQN